MTASSSDVMRVLDRCLDTVESSTETDQLLVAAAGRAMTDPNLHDAVSRLLAEDHLTRSTSLWSCLRRTAAALSASGDVEGRPVKQCDENNPVVRIVIVCEAASRASGQIDTPTAEALSDLFLTAIVLEKSSLGTDESRYLRNQAVHGDIAAALVKRRILADRGSRPA